MAATPAVRGRGDDGLIQHPRHLCAGALVGVAARAAAVLVRWRPAAGRRGQLWDYRG
jgi:hypothetical protein